MTDVLSRQGGFEKTGSVLFRRVLGCSILGRAATTGCHQRARTAGLLLRWRRAAPLLWFADRQEGKGQPF
eukprot:3128517-Lingulodinium_polyedra.AAC.1